MGKKIDITNPSKYGRLKILGESEEIHRSGKRKVRYVNVLCECGNKNTTRLDHLVAGRTKSCGCHKLEILKQKGKNLKHGDSRKSLHHRWNGIISRCYNKNNESYYRYGGRGITMCQEWRNDYRIFKDWALKNGYKKNLQIDRIDNDGNYEPKNCRWVTNTENANNKSTNVFITYKGETKTLSMWARQLKINKSTLQTRIVRRAQPINIAFETPIKKYGNS